MDTMNRRNSTCCAKKAHFFRLAKSLNLRNLAKTSRKWRRCSSGVSENMKTSSSYTTRITSQKGNQDRPIRWRGQQLHGEAGARLLFRENVTNFFRICVKTIFERDDTSTDNSVYRGLISQVCPQTPQCPSVPSAITT